MDKLGRRALASCLALFGLLAFSSAEAQPRTGFIFARCTKGCNLTDVRHALSGLVPQSKYSDTQKLIDTCKSTLGATPGGCKDDQCSAQCSSAWDAAEDRQLASTVREVRDGLSVQHLT